MRSARTQTITGVFAITLTMTMGILSSPPATAEQHQPCAEDVRKLCPDIQPRDRRAVVRCLAEHKDELSSACQERIQSVRRKGTEFRQACSQDVQTFCGDVRPGHRRVWGCLQRHREELSAPCQEAMAQSRRKREGR